MKITLRLQPKIDSVTSNLSPLWMRFWNQPASWLIPKNHQRRNKMEQKVDNKKKIMKVVIWVIAIVALLGTMHILVNYFDLFTFLQKLHGG